MMQYSGKEVLNFETKIDTHVLNLIRLIRSKYVTINSKIKPLDMAEKASFFTMDAISDIAFSRTWGCLESDADVDDWFGSMEIFLPLAIRAATIPFISDLFAVPFISRLAMPSEKDVTGPGRLLCICRNIVKGRFESSDPGKEPDMLGSFIRHGVPQHEAVAEATTQMFVTQCFPQTNFLTRK
jgi:hypothetical protein